MKLGGFPLLLIFAGSIAVAGGIVVLTHPEAIAAGWACLAICGILLLINWWNERV
jgi:hypothetical protein